MCALANYIVSQTARWWRRSGGRASAQRGIVADAEVHNALTVAVALAPVAEHLARYP